MCRTLIGLVDEELTILSVEEEERIFVAFLHNPATAILRVDFDFAVLAAHLLFGQELVISVVNLEVGVAIGVVDQSIHIVSTHGVGDQIQAVGLLDILAHHNHIGYMIVEPVAIAIHPEARPVVGSRDERIPVESVAVDHAMVMGMPEVRCGMDGSV